MRPILFALCALGLAGCSFKTEWRDTTGQARARQVAEADAKDCMGASGEADLRIHHSDSELRAFKARMDACMAERGWKLMRVS